MNIGIDIDGVINDLSLFHITCGTEFCYEKGIEININSQAMDSKDIFGWNKEIDAIFWYQYYLQLLLYPDFVRHYVSSVTQKLSNKGHSLYIISARKNNDLPYFEKQSMYDITQKYLENNNIHYDKLYLSDNKWELIDSLDINLMIEDNPLFFTSSTQTQSIPLMCFNTPYNQNVYGKNVIRVHSWYEILFKITNEI